MPAPKCTDEQILEALEKHNGLRAPVAAELGLVYRALIERLNRMRARGIEIPDSSYHSTEVRGTSTLLGPKGEVRLQWIKEAPTEKTREQWVQAVREAFAEAEPVKRIPTPPVASKRLLTVFPIGDMHVGAHSWIEETGSSYDVKIAEQLLVSAAEHLVDISPPCDTCLIANVGDYLHYDSHRTETPTNHNALDADSRYLYMIRGGVRMLRTFIECALAKYRTVRVINSPGNHDPIGALWLSLALTLLYEKNPRVHIDQSPGRFAYVEHGKVMICVTHGDSVKIEKLPGVMAADQPEMWGRTKHRYGYTGHVHKDRVIELPGIWVESFRTLAAADAWAHGQGYRSGRDIHSIVLHDEYGEVQRHTFNPAMLKAA